MPGFFRNGILGGLLRRNSNSIHFAHCPEYQLLIRIPIQLNWAQKCNSRRKGTDVNIRVVLLSVLSHTGADLEEGFAPGHA